MNTTNNTPSQVEAKNQIEFTRVNNCINGNPRYVCHFMELLTPEEKIKDFCSPSDIFGVESKYIHALARARKIGGKKYHTKQFGGGIVFQSYNLNELQKDINELLNEKQLYSFKFSFVGREANAIGKTHKINKTYKAESKQKALDMLYTDYEHITTLCLNGELLAHK